MNVVMMLQVMALGLGTVFIVLILLILVINLINKVINRKKKEKKGLAINVEPQVVQTAPQETEEEDDTLIAVITAAVCACLNTSTHNFRVHSIRERKSRWSRW